MRPDDSPFPTGWWGTDLGDVGIQERLPFLGTYRCYDFARLPPLPYPMTGRFEWLAQAPPQSGDIGRKRLKENAQALGELRSAADMAGIRLPAAFTTFLSTPSLHQRIRSNTDCFLDVNTSITGSPAGNGHLIRFLADSQGCLFWYVYLSEDGSDHAVVSSPGFYGNEAEDWNDKPDASAIVFGAECFESFVCRFWLENEIWFSGYDKSPMPEAGQAYIDDYKNRA